MTVNNFIPEVWSPKIFQDFQKATLFGNLCNRDYEGEITAGGDTVRINAIGPVNITAYTKNSTANITVQTLADAQTVLPIDQQYYFAFQVDDVDQAQTNPKVMGEAMRKASFGLALNADAYVAGLYTDAGASTYASMTVASSDYKIVKMFGRMMQMLDEMDCPRQNRWAVVPPFIENIMVQQNLVMNLGMRDSIFLDGYVGRYMGFDIYMSNNLAQASTHSDTSPDLYALAGSNDAITFADQILKTEAYRDPNHFGDIVRGLHVYGAKVIQPRALVAYEVRAT
jgi:hypothetical protein